MITIRIEQHDRATPIIRAMGAALEPRAVNSIVGRAAVGVFKSHLFGLDGQRPNALGGSRTHYYTSAARGTHFDVVPNGVMISINQVGFRYRVLGGTITPKKKKYLTIPARAEAYGHRAGEFNDLVVVFGKGGRPVALARAGQTLIGHKRDKATGRVTGATKRGSAGGEIMFWLVKSVTGQPDPSLLPSEAALGAAISEQLGRHVQLRVDRARAAAETRSN